MRAIIALAFSLCAPLLAHSELLKLEDILENIEGVWAIPYEIDETGAHELRCDQNPLQIRIFEENNQLIYESEILGQGHIARSEVNVWEVPNGEIAPYLLLQYEGETRTTKDGTLVQWRLIMPDPNTFFWQRTDWPTNGMTTPRKRCEPSAGIS